MPDTITPSNQQRQHVCITGGLGLVGSIVCKALLKQADKYEIYIIDCVAPAKEIPRVIYIQVDVSDYNALFDALHGYKIDIIVHLGAARENKSVDEIKRVNYQGTNNIFKFALACGVQRIIYASSLLVMYGYRLMEPYASMHRDQTQTCLAKIIETDEVKLPSHNLEIGQHHKEYAESKLYGERLAEQYAREHNISCIIIRFGYVNSENSWQGNPNWCSYASVCRSIFLAMNAPKDIQYKIIFGISDNPNAYFRYE